MIASMDVIFELKLSHKTVLNNCIFFYTVNMLSWKCQKLRFLITL